VRTWHAGQSGNVLINENADRINSYNVWNYAEGHDTYYRSMLVDLTQPPDKVSDLLFRLFVRRIGLVLFPNVREIYTSRQKSKMSQSFMLD